MPLGHGELALERDDFQRIIRANEVPEGRLARCRGDANARRPAVDVVGQIGGFGVPGQRADAADLGLGEQGVVRQPVVLQQRRQGAAPAPESQRVDRQHAHVGIDCVAVIARRGVLLRHGLAHDHPEGVGRGDVVPAGQHEAVAKRVLGPAIVISQRAVLGSAEMQGHVVWRIGQRPAEVAGLGVVAQQHQRHRGHEPNVFDPIAVVGGDFSRVVDRHRLNRARAGGGVLGAVRVRHQSLLLGSRDREGRLQTAPGCAGHAADEARRLFRGARKAPKRVPDAPPIDGAILCRSKLPAGPFRHTPASGPRGPHPARSVP